MPFVGESAVRTCSARIHFLGDADGYLSDVRDALERKARDRWEIGARRLAEKRIVNPVKNYMIN